MRFALCFLVAFLVACGNAQFPGLFPPRPEDECVGPEDGGLRPVLDEVQALFPAYEFLAIFLEAMSYEVEVQQTFLFLQSETFGRIVYDVSNMDGWRHVIDYFCEELGAHIDHYLSGLGDLFEIRPHPRIARRSPSAFRRPGLVGLLQDIQEIMPTEEMTRIITEAYRTNEHVRRAVAKIQGDEFRSVAEAIEAMDEFAEIKERMRNIGVDVDCMVCGLKSVLGWIEGCPQC